MNQINPEAKETIGRRVAELTAIMGNMKAALLGMERYRHDLLVSIATVCKVEGFNDTVLPVFDNHLDHDIVVKFHRKDVRSPIEPGERREIDFRMRTVYAMGFAYIREEQGAHDLVFYIKVK